MRTYGQYCPIARASEIIAERWTPIIVRNMFVGCRTFTEISAGAPGLSRTLLAQRLRQLESMGLVEARPKLGARGLTYELTEAGRDLWGTLSALGAWGERWLELRDEHTNPRFLLWAWSTGYLATDRTPDRRVVVRFDFQDQESERRRVWMVFERGGAEVCLKYPGFAEDLVVETDARTLAEWHTGHLEWYDALRSGRIRIAGARQLARALPTWNLRHPVAYRLPERAVHHQRP